MVPDETIEYNAAFYCPITGSIMLDPVIDREGNSYERSAIEKWIHEHNRSPITRNPLSIKDLIPNRVLQQTIEKEIYDRDRHQIISTQTRRPNLPSFDLNMKNISIDFKSHLIPSNGNEKNSSLNYNILTSAVCSDQSVLRIPSNIILIIDVSGSMNDIAKPPTPSPGSVTNESDHFGLSLLDIVKHATRTVIETLNENDSLALITFSTN